jgi:linoleoyl-CoA desaturase
MKKQLIRFSRKDPKKFFITLNKRVNNHFKDLKIATTGNWKLYVKTLIMFLLFFTPYFVILFSNFGSLIKLGLCIIMGIGMAGVGMNVMHDGNHGSFSKKKMD